MLGISVRRSSRRSLLASAIVAVPIAGLLAAVVVIAVAVGQPNNGITGSPAPALIGEHSALGERQVDALNAAIGATGSQAPALIGEHSVLGERQVDALNAAIASMRRATGEHAGLSRTDYEAGARLD